ncbi:uncharacterized protein DDB_G0271670-like [Saccostrea cucullata]|uniref:uncharacterized protein DDB_G0271670-like n=1 Tax=Saccostrea cuccullata TaxID=36930 RepID=UPI002ED36482
MNIRNETQCFGLEDWKTLTDNSNASDCVAFSGKTSQFVILPCNTQLPVLCSSSFEATTLASVSRLTTDPVPSTSVSASILTTSSTASSSTSVSTSTPTTSSTTGSSTSVSTSSPTTSSTTGSSTSVSTSTPSTSPTTGSSTSVSTPTTSSTTGSSTSVSTSTPSTSPTTGSSTSVSTSTPTTSTGSSTSVSSSTQTKSSKAVSSTLAPKSSTTDSVPSTTTSPLKTVSSTLAASSLSTSTPKSSSTVKSSTDTFQSVYVSSSLSTTQTTYLMKSTTASSVNQGCMCPCERMKNQVFITDKKVLKAKIEKMKKELKVNKADLNKKLRKRLSVFDKRASAIAFGTIFGPLLIAFFIGIIVFSDIPIMMRHLKYGLCRRLGKKKRKRRIGSDDVRGCVTDVQKDKDEIQEDEIIDNPA